MELRTVVVAATVGLALGLLPGWASQGAQEVPAARIAVIDGQRVVNESNAGRAANERAQAVQSEWQERINEKRQELDALVRQRQEQALTLNEDALAALSAQIEEKQVELQRLQDDANRELRKLTQRLMDEMNAVLVPLVQQLAEEGDYHLVLDSSQMRGAGLLYHAAAIDVTDRFIAMVNAASAGPAAPSTGR